MPFTKECAVGLKVGGEAGIVVEVNPAVLIPGVVEVMAGPFDPAVTQVGGEGEGAQAVGLDVGFFGGDKDLVGPGGHADSVWVPVSGSSSGRQLGSRCLSSWRASGEEQGQGSRPRNQSAKRAKPSSGGGGEAVACGERSESAVVLSGQWWCRVLWQSVIRSGCRRRVQKNPAG